MKLKNTKTKYNTNNKFKSLSFLLSTKLTIRYNIIGTGKKS